MKQKNKQEKQPQPLRAEAQPESILFWKFIVEKQQLTEWIICFLSCLAGYLCITYFYPYPATYSDSFSYVAAAADNQFYIFRPFGYSAFLRFLHPISSSMAFVVISQFFLYFISVSLLVLSLKKYYPLKAYIRIPVTILIAIFPATIYMLNALMSDALFCCTILMMIAMLLVLFNDKRLTWVAAIVYLIAFHCSLYLRYSAMFFPIAIIPFLLFVRKQWIKWSVIAMTCIVFALFHKNISENMYKTVHLHQFSTGFDGWQLANNGLHILPYLEETDTPKNKKIAHLHHFCMDSRFDSLIQVVTCGGKAVTAEYLWNRDLPLKQYLFQYMQEKRMSYPVAWAKLGGGLYSDYGKWLIINHPGLFFKYYLSKNILSGFYPTFLELVGHYSEIPTGDKDIIRWFDANEDEPFPCKNPVFEKMPPKLLPVLELVDWILMLLAVVVLCTLYKTSFSKREKILSFGLIFVFGFLYYGSTIFASPIALRYWMPMHALKWAIVWMALSELSQRLSIRNQ